MQTQSTGLLLHYKTWFPHTKQVFPHIGNSWTSSSVDTRTWRNRITQSQTFSAQFWFWFISKQRNTGDWTFITDHLHPINLHTDATASIWSCDWAGRWLVMKANAHLTLKTSVVTYGFQSVQTKFVGGICTNGRDGVNKQQQQQHYWKTFSHFLKLVITVWSSART